MSAFPDDAGHFARWLAARGLGGPFDFAPRRTYRAYLEEQLAEATRRAASRLAFVSGEALDVARAGRRPVLRLADGRAIQADAVVLASGNLPPRTPAWARALSDDVYRPDPWSPGLCEGLAADDTVLLVGTGLTMIDTLVSLTDAGFQGRILATSRRGLLPRVHGPATAPPIAHHYGPHLPLSDLLHVFRRRADEAGWRAAMDEVRHSAQALWRAADEERRARFLRHLRPWWDVHRHRIAPAVADRLAELQAAGRFQVIAGKIEGAEAAEGRARVHLRLRGTQFKAAYDVRRIINCTGSDADLGRTGDPLLQRLTTSGAIRPDAHRLGVEIGARGEAIGRDGRPTPGLYALGPIARGRSWEATAVPELRVLAADMAQGLVEELVPAERDRAEL